MLEKLTMIGSLIVRERDGKPYRVTAFDGQMVTAKTLDKSPRAALIDVLIDVARIGRGFGYVISEPDEASLAVADRIVEAVTKSGMVAAQTRRGNTVLVHYSGHDYTVRTARKLIFRTGFPPALTKRLASWGAKLRTT